MSNPNVYPPRSQLSRTLGNSPEQWVRRNRRRFARPSPFMRRARAIAERARRRAAICTRYLAVVNETVDALAWIAMEQLQHKGKAGRGE